MVAFHTKFCLTRLEKIVSSKVKEAKKAMEKVVKRALMEFGNDLGTQRPLEAEFDEVNLFRGTSHNPMTGGERPKAKAPS